MDGLKNSTSSSGTTPKKETNDVIINGVNILRIPSRDVYAYALSLLDILFSKEELSQSLLFQSKKSKKSALDPERVQKLLDSVEMKYGEWDLKLLTSKINQKCRDSGPKDTIII